MSWSIPAFLSLLAVAAAAQPAADPHAGHGMPPASADPHAGHVMPAASHAGHGGMSAAQFGPVPDTREASGTSWQPDDSPMHAHHGTAGAWALMTHYNLFLGYDDQSGPRGGAQANSINWLMAMATRRDAVNEITFRGMFSLEPWTTTTKGYPLLFQSGEVHEGLPIIDRQHPHDFFMEAAARYRRLLSPDTVLSLYAGAAGEPALGPPAFPHRVTAMDNPAAPISHHWLDSTHISFGVVTAGIARRTWQIESSVFNGREPDEKRWDFDFRPLDSYSGRITWNPTPAWSAQVSHAYLESPEELHPDEHLWRTTASLLYAKKLAGGARAALSLAWGRNNHGHGVTNALLIEPAYQTDTFSIFGRLEYVEKMDEELGLVPADRRIPIRQVMLGATRELVRDRPWQAAVGGAVTLSVMPRDLEATYGRRPLGCWVFLRLRPAAAKH